MNDEIAYGHSIVSFLDILGFAAFVEDTATPANDVYTILKQAREKSYVDGQMTEMCGIRNIAISDCVIRTAEIDEPFDQILAPEILSELLALAFVQLEFFEVARRPIRGGITHGRCYHDDNNFVFGPAYQEAVKLEKAAKSPRIVVSESIINDFKGYPEGQGDITFANANQEFDELVKVDPDDGKRFIDYMSVILSDPDANRELFLHQHKDFISDNLHESTKHYDKYVWLRDYHNRTVAAFELTQGPGTLIHLIK